MSMSCLFRLCRWRHVFNVKDAENNFGVYQCTRCKTISLGSSRDLVHPNHQPDGEIDMNDEQIENEIQAKGLTAPRVTPQRIEEVIAEEVYFTALQGFEGSYGGAAKLAHAIMDGSAHEPPSALGLLTICVLVLKNGFTVTGESACASPENFDAELGRKIARQHAVSKIWPLEGYLLRQSLADA